MNKLQARVLICSVVLSMPVAHASELPVALPQSEVQMPVKETAALHWGLDGALFKSFSGENTVSSARGVARRLVTDSISGGVDVRYWTSNSYPLAATAGTGSWAVGANGQFELFRSHYFGAYVGASFLWVPGPGQLAAAPEAGIKWFATQWIALGLSYSVLTDLGSSIISFEPAASGQSRQSLGLGLSVYL